MTCWRLPGSKRQPKTRKLTVVRNSDRNVCINESYILHAKAVTGPHLQTVSVLPLATTAASS
jgi:hypothetical protein